MDPRIRDFSRKLATRRPAFSGDRRDGQKRPIQPWQLQKQQLKIPTEGSYYYVFPGNYDNGAPFFEYWSTWTKREGTPRQIYCNCLGGSAKDTPCALCTIAENEQNPDLLPKLKIAVNVIELAEFHKVEKVSPKGAKYYELERCKGQDALGRNLCSHCEAKIATQFGRRGWLSLGRNFWVDFKGVMRKVGKICKSCGQPLFALDYHCSSCGELLFDPGKTPLTELIEIQFEEEDQTCPTCVKKGMAVPRLQCYKKQTNRLGKSSMVNSCNKPEPLTIFDTPLHLATTGGDKSSIILLDVESIKGPTPLDPRVVQMAKPYDFFSFLGHMDVTLQAEALGRDNPFGAVTGGSTRPVETEMYSRD